MEVRFKIAEERDIEGIIQLCNACFNEDTPLEYAKAVFQKTKDTGRDFYIVGVVGEEVIAHAKITIVETMYQPMMTYAILNHVCVKPDYRRFKIATHMLTEIENVCKKKGCVKMELWTMTLQMTQNKKIQDLLYFKGKIEETNIIVKREEKAKTDYNLSIMVSINI